MKTTYTIKQIELNSWRVDEDGNQHNIELWDCGHKHRTIKGAVRCLLALSGTTRSIGARIESSDGSDVDDDAVNRAEMEILGWD